MSQISLGNIVPINGKTTSSGVSSGLDSASLIESIIEARNIKIEDYETQISSNDERVTKLGELKTLLANLRTASDFLRSPPGVGNEADDFFKYATTSLTSNTTVSASNYLGVNAAPGATTAQYTISDITLARKHILQINNITSQTASITGNSTITDNYTASMTYVSDTTLDTTTPLAFSNDVVGDKATIDVVFGSQNEFDATDSITFGTTTITFGGGGGNDIDISSATTVAEKVTAIATRMNAITSGEEAEYNYIADGTTLKVQKNIIGTNSEVGTDMTITADFSATNSTQTIAIGSESASNNPTGGAVNSLGSDGGFNGTKAVMYVRFGDQNSFDASDTFTVGDEILTFGGDGGNDLDFSGTDADTLSEKISLIATRLNALASLSDYTFTASGDTLKIEHDTVGDNDTVTTNLTVSSDFSKGVNTTQTIKIGSLDATNSVASGAVNTEGTDGTNAPRKSNIQLLFSADNEFDVSSDQIVIGATTITFKSGGGDSGDVLDISADTTLEEKLQHIADHMNLKTSGDESNYRYSVSGGTTLVITNKEYGTDSTNLSVSTDFSIGGGTSQTVTIGSGGALEIGPSNGSQSGTVNTNGTTGRDLTSIANENTIGTSTLSGSITMGTPLFVEGSGDADSFSPNYVVLKATVGGETYTSRPVYLDGGTSTGGSGSGSSGFGDTIASGTTITFVKDTPTNLTDGVKDVTFTLTTGDAETIANQSEAETFATNIGTFLSTNSVSITQESEASLPFTAGTSELGGINLTLEEGDNLQNIVAKINATSSTSGVSADIIKVADENYSLVLKSTNEGTDNAIREYGSGDIDDPASGTIKFGGSYKTFSETQAASDSSFSLDGTTITRSSNAINDVISNVTFSLLSATPDSNTSITVDISPDTETVKTGVNTFINAYNNLKLFISEQTEKNSDNEFVDTAILGGESILQDILIDVNAQLNQIFTGLTTGSPNSIFNAGLDTIDFPGDDETPATSGLFVLDEATFDSKIAANFDDIRKLFAYDFTSTSADLSIFERNNNSTITNFKLVIDTTQTLAEQVQVQDSNGNFLYYADYNSTTNTITGKSGTTLEGTTMIYTGDGSDTITVSINRGTMDRLFNVLDNTYLPDDTGVVDSTVDEKGDENERIQEKIDFEQERIDREVEVLLARFSRLEQAVAASNQILSFLAQQTAQLNNN